VNVAECIKNLDGGIVQNQDPLQAFHGDLLLVIASESNGQFWVWSINARHLRGGVSTSSSVGFFRHLGFSAGRTSVFAASFGFASAGAASEKNCRAQEGWKRLARMWNTHGRRSFRLW